MEQADSVKALASKVEEIHRLAQDLYESSEEFPAVNRNAKRILAATQMLRINLEEA